MGNRFTFACLTVVALTASGCATANKSGFLSGYERLHRGEYLESYWSAPGLNRQAVSRIYVDPIDTSRVKDQPNVTVGDASSWLNTAIVSSIQTQPGWSTVEQSENSTSKLLLAITRLTPGSAGGRIFAGELGMGHASVQVEAKLIDPGTGAELACLADRRRDSGAIGFEDVGGDAGPKLVKRMLEKIASDLVKEVSSSVDVP